MIRYTLKCGAGHGFDSWFADAAAYEALARAGQLACPVCGQTSVEKALMAPAVAQPRSRSAEAEAPAPDLRAPGSDLEAKLAALRQHVEANSEYVGVNFVAEARRMHEGEAPERSIHGEAKPEEARKLLEDGIPVAPLPFLPGRKAN
ncbi:DUF1178 family protein [Neotabrizicola sp. VNH66]|uniref:DUF1178 family protein n=1 Tax=Neotabrizicola sp. VNH66 TaxID=3400918 RepID=UPI003C0F7953